MPPKKSKKNQPRRSQNPRNTVIAIEQHFRRSGQGDSPEDVARKLSQAYQEDPSSLNNSLVCFILRACGLAAEVPKLDFSEISGSLSTIMDLANERKVGFENERIPLVNKDKANERYIQKIREFMGILLRDDYQPMRAHRDNKMLACLYQCIHIISKSPIRYLRLASNILACIIVETMSKHFVTLMDRKESRKAFELVKEVELYLPLLKERTRDRDSRVREMMHVTLKQAFLGMETDLFTEKTIQDFFLPLIKYGHPKITEQAMETLLSVLKNSNKLKKAMLAFTKSNFIQLWRAAMISNKGGVQTIRFLIEMYRFDPSSDLLSPERISHMFEGFQIERYSLGTQAAIEAFYASVQPSNEELFKNRNNVAIEIMNLVSNFSAVQIRQSILHQFCEYGKVPIEDIFSIPDLFAVLLEQAYTQNGEQIEFKQQQLVSWLVMIDSFMDYVHKNLNRLENVSSEKLQKERQKWLDIGQAFNMHLLSNIKTIIHEKMHGKLTICFLQLMGKLVLPVGSAFEGYLDFMYQRIVGIFERETEMDIFKEIVKIFSRTNTHNIGLLVKGLTGQSQSRSRKQRTTILLKKISILHQFFIQDFITLYEVQELISTFKQTESLYMKIDILIGVLIIHQWWINFIVENGVNEQKLTRYDRIKEAIIMFYFGVLESSERLGLKLKAVGCLLRIFELICGDAFVGQPLIYYAIQEHHIGLIYRFLNCEIGLPLPDEQDEEGRDFARLMGHISFEDADRETILLQLFAVFKSSMKVASFPASIRFITGALLAEEQKQENADFSTTHVNLSLSVDRMPYPSLYARDKPTSKFLAKLVQRQLSLENRNTFIFWQLVQNIFREMKRELKVKEAFINKALDIYFKKKLTGEAYNTSMNKVLLFVMSEVDRINQDKCYDGYHLVRIIMSKLVKRKVRKESIRRVFMFVREKSEPQEYKQEYKGLLSFLDKASKAAEVKEQQEPVGSQGQGEGERDGEGELNEREMMRPIGSRRQTRSMSKRYADDDEE